MHWASGQICGHQGRTFVSRFCNLTYHIISFDPRPKEPRPPSQTGAASALANAAADTCSRLASTPILGWSPTEASTHFESTAALAPLRQPSAFGPALSPPLPVAPLPPLIQFDPPHPHHLPNRAAATPGLWTALHARYSIPHVSSPLRLSPGPLPPTPSPTPPPPTADCHAEDLTLAPCLLRRIASRSTL